MNNNSQIFEPLAKVLYEKEPIIEMHDSSPIIITWEDVKDSYPATYEYYIELAVRTMYQ